MLECNHLGLICRFCGIEAGFKHRGLRSVGVNIKPGEQFKYKFTDEYLRIRVELIDQLLLERSHLNLSENTLHLAIHFMDVINAQDNSQASMCLWIAAKQLDVNIPRLRQLNGLDVKLEITVIRLLQWKLIQWTLYEQVQGLLALGVLFETDQCKLLKLNQPTKNYLCSQFIKQYHNVVLYVIKNHAFLLIHQPTLALAIVLYLRKLNHVTPIYPTQLHRDIPIQSLISTFEQLCIHLDPFFINQLKLVTQSNIQLCKSLPPPNRRAPLKQISNTNQKPKQIHQKHEEECPLRKLKY